MSKRTSKSKPPGRVGRRDDLSDADLKKLAETLIDTSGNIYSLARTMFGAAVQVNDRTFERLEKLERIFRCEECSVWQETGERSSCGLDKLSRFSP